eukprot:1794830-Pleurochrysis_carterae.AAC.1
MCALLTPELLQAPIPQEPRNYHERYRNAAKRTLLAMRGTINGGDDAISYHGLAQKDSFAAYQPMRRPKETLTEYLSEALRGLKI